jgi:hypothetical protein
MSRTLFFARYLFIVFLLIGAHTAHAQYPLPEDVSSPEALVLAAYESIQRAPGEDYQWERFESLFLAEAITIPNTEQNGGAFSVLTPDQFRRIVDTYTTVGGPTDQGFQEEQIHSIVHQYGDIAQVFSTYEKHFWESDEILAQGMNSFQMIRKDGQWRIVSIVWDENYAGGPIPEQYGGTAPNTTPDPLHGPEDFSTPHATVASAYRAIERAPGDPFDWTHLRAMFLPQARLIPNTEQSGGSLIVHTPGSFAAMLETMTPVGSPEDVGLREREIHAVVHEYGDIAQVFSTYETSAWHSGDILARGINSFQLVRHDGRWWVVGIVWDEENAAGAIPARYGG